MNKSKFLKRSLATLLAVLMVVAMVPMSALAEDDDTSTAPAAPEYTVVVNNREAAFKDGGFDATVYSTYILSVALYGLPEGVKVDLLTKNGNVVPLTSTTAVDLKQEATLVSETERTSLYNITLRETKGGESKEYTLAVTVENVVPVDNVDIKSVRTEEGDVIDSIIGENEITLILPLGNDESDVHNEGGAALSGAAFVPANFAAKAVYSNKSVTVTAADNSSKTYKVNFTNETGFETFTVPGQIGETEISDNGLTVSIKVPKASTPGDNLKKIVPSWTTSESGNVQKVYSGGINDSAADTHKSLVAKGSMDDAHTAGIYGVVSGRGEYDFNTTTNAQATNNTITFFVKTKATALLGTSAPVQVTITETDKYVGTGIKDFTITAYPTKETTHTPANAIPLATVYNVTANNTVYMPAGYTFHKDDTIDMEIHLDDGATARIVSQSSPLTDPVTVTDGQTFKGIETNGRMFTIQVKAEDENVAAANYRVNLIAASSSQADLSNNSGLRFQIGGDDGKSMAATFDRQNVTNGQYDMTIKVPFGTLTPAVADKPTTYEGEVTGESGDEVTVDTWQVGNNHDNSPTSTADFTELKEDIIKTNLTEHNNVDGTDKFPSGKIVLKLGSDDTSVAKTMDLGILDSDDGFHKFDIYTTTAATTDKSATLTSGSGYGDVEISVLGTFDWSSIFWGNDPNNPGNNTGWAYFGDGTEQFAYVETGLTYVSTILGGDNYATINGGTDATGPYTAGSIASLPIYALVSPGASAYIGTSAIGGKEIKNSITPFGKLYYDSTSIAQADDVLGDGSHREKSAIFYVYVVQNEVKKTYRIKLVEEDARTGNKITDNAIIADDNIIGEGFEYTGTPVEKSGNNSLLKVAVPYEWRGVADAYIYNGLTLSDGAVAYIETSSGLVEVAANSGTTLGAASTYGTLNNKIIEKQTDVEAIAANNAGGKTNVFDNGKTPVVKDLSDRIYVISEAEADRLKKTQAYIDASPASLSAYLKTYTNYSDLASYAHIYNVYYERNTANNQAQLLTVGSSTPGVRATLDYTKTVNVRVPNSFNWSTYRDNSECDFTIDFTVSDGASLSDNAYGTWATGKTNFFVKDSELFVFDKLTGRKTQITNEGEYEPQAAMLTVTSQNRKVSNTYPFRLTIAQPESNNKLKKVVVGETEAAISGSDVTVTLPAGSELKAQDVFITPDSDVATVQNDKGEAFDSTVKHDLSEPMKFTITAEDGTKAEYTLTAKVGGSVVDPDKKPSDSYTDLDKVTNETMRNKVKAAIDMGIMGSTSTTKFVFAPKAEIGRKDIAVIIARADLIASNDTIADKDQADEALKAMYTDGETAFDDLTKCNDIQKAAIRYCSEKDIISGDGKGGFAPDGKLTREAIAVILTNWTKIEVDKNNTENVNKIADWSNVSNWAKPYVNAVYGKLMNGKGNGFDPKGIVNREQTASVLVDAFGIIYPEFGN